MKTLKTIGILGILIPLLVLSCNYGNELEFRQKYNCLESVVTYHGLTAIGEI
jgi:hypothetical protein